MVAPELDNSELKGLTISLHKRFYDLATILPTLRERHDFIFGLLAAMFDSDADNWLTDERVNMLLATAYTRVKDKFPNLQTNGI